MISPAPSSRYHIGLPDRDVADNFFLLGSSVTTASAIAASARSGQVGRSFAINLPLAFGASFASYEIKKHSERPLTACCG